MNQETTPGKDRNNPEIQSESRQEQTDPQLTELKGFTDSSKDLEPTLTDGTKAPEKEQEKRSDNEQVR
ncbi:hypothetical protein SAMN05444008_104144 [Cnuella takakiae]|uniref:Uncharacterized protein n=1 Tax=Cnuella takakiae TaxID=1302690 RepID=A0A1M4Y4P1_9BACT|nr:hypothetical protein [Cnuella takakiae]OLY93041.1 hypothetical protein BUE76_14900 [Cnuella takakiae]SHF00432.1 hypothetical protein SAMN05444008_104144 [Cnuella takakiae]